MADNGNKIVDLPDRQAVREEASLWIARLESRDDPHTMVADLQTWLNKSSVHREEFRRLSALWDDLDILDDLNYLDNADAVPARTALATHQQWLRYAGTTAALILVGIVTYMSLNSSTDMEQFATFNTAFGEVETVTLRDGSTLTLNTDTVVEVAMANDERRLTLIKGEAHFAVAKDASRPFTVYAGQGLVRAIGTAFSVYLKERDIEVTVSEGRVELMANSASQTLEGANLENRPEPILLRVIAAGDQAVIADDTLKRLEPLSEIAINRKLSWRSGMLAFAGEPLSDVLEQVSRYTDVRVDITDTHIAALPIGGYFKVGDLDGLLEALETTFGVRSEWVSDKHVRITQGS